VYAQRVVVFCLVEWNTCAGLAVSDSGGVSLVDFYMRGSIAVRVHEACTENDVQPNSSVGLSLNRLNERLNLLRSEPHPTRPLYERCITLSKSSCVNTPNLPLEEPLKKLLSEHQFEDRTTLFAILVTDGGLDGDVDHVVSGCTAWKWVLNSGCLDLSCLVSRSHDDPVVAFGGWVPFGGPEDPCVS
jgi:hypothetical protein